MAPGRGYREESDSLGKKGVPRDAYYGIFTQRALENFQLSGSRVHSELVKALGMVKAACAQANMSLGLLDRRIGSAIAKAAMDVAGGRLGGWFPLDVYQAGAGTPTNMNANEVIANRAIELLGGKRGDYDIVHPNNHVNMSQSSNDAMPTAIRLACLGLSTRLARELGLLSVSLEKKAREFRDVIKVGRTHMQDAVPIMLGQEFQSYATAMTRCSGRIRKSMDGLLEVGLGGTAVGTGLNTHPKFRKEAVKRLAALSGYGLYPAKDPIHATNSMDSFMELSSSLRLLASEMLRICDDFVLMNAGPNAGINEIELPAVEPGSSIMPGKINPSIAEALKMACLQVLGNDHAVAEACREGQLELNVMTPLIADNLLLSLGLLSRGARMFREKCVAGIKANRERIGELFDMNLSVATALNPYLGYENTTKLVKLSLRQNKPLRELILEHGLMSKKDIDILLDPGKLTGPREIDKALLKRIRESKGFGRFSGGRI
ncbi:MAG: aspartate ammonia-lyase [Candidatus Aenigmarchaeota archaeon]|nr:aspartate ammonia-lyase [Candidatus Aenigmarchaeota archaeon]